MILFQAICFTVKVVAIISVLYSREFWLQWNETSLWFGKGKPTSRELVSLSWSEHKSISVISVSSADNHQGTYIFSQLAGKPFSRS